MSLANALSVKPKLITGSKPRIFDLRKHRDRTLLSRLFSSRQIQRVVDDYEEQLREYFQVQNPRLVFAPDFEKQFKEYVTEIEKKTPLWQQGRWVYFPWISTLVHILEDKQFQIVRTNRNKNLITAEEQEKFYNAVIGIAGLSVGNSVALAIALQGGGRHMRLADHDRLALSNLNRIRAGIDSLGIKKTEMTARQIYLLNPYARLELFFDGLTEKNIKKFFEGPPKLDIVVDEVDNFAIKYRIREYARKFRIPVLMGVDNGRNAMVDIERYDLNPKTPFFHGKIGDVAYKKLLFLNKLETGKMIVKLIGPENIPKRMWQSFKKIGKTLVSWPQLGNTTLLNGVAVTFCIHRSINKQSLGGNRTIISLDRSI